MDGESSGSPFVFMEKTMSMIADPLTRTKMPPKTQETLSTQAAMLTYSMPALPILA